MSRAIAVWVLVLAILSIPVIAAGFSPFLAWRQPIYIIAGFAGIVGMAVMPLQPAVAAGYLPGLSVFAARRLHRTTGAFLIALVIAHVIGLWVTSPPDMIDAILLRSPTPFSHWGVIAMWAIFAAGLLAAFRAKLRLRWRTWRRLHTSLTVVAVSGTVAHAVLIEGTMETFSKAALGLLLIFVTVKSILDLRIWSSGARN